MENKNRVLLFDKLQKNYENLAAEWSVLTPAELIDKAEEIYATKLVKEQLMQCVDEKTAGWFLRFRNLLEIVRDKWMEENGTELPHDEELSHAVWSITDCQDTDSLYEMEANAEPSGTQPVTVREFIERHPNVAFDMMTPGGFVYLTPDRAESLLDGQSVKGHPGEIEYTHEIPAEELLNQEVVRANFNGTEWKLLSDELHEKERQIPSSEQGMRLC